MDRLDQGPGVKFPPPLLYVTFLSLGILAFVIDLSTAFRSGMGAGGGDAGSRRGAGPDLGNTDLAQSRNNRCFL